MDIFTTKRPRSPEEIEPYLKIGKSIEDFPESYVHWDKKIPTNEGPESPLVLLIHFLSQASLSLTKILNRKTGLYTNYSRAVFILINQQSAKMTVLLL